MSGFTTGPTGYGNPALDDTSAPIASGFKIPDNDIAAIEATIHSTEQRSIPDANIISGHDHLEAREAAGPRAEDAFWDGVKDSLGDLINLLEANASLLPLDASRNALREANDARHTIKEATGERRTAPRRDLVERRRSKNGKGKKDKAKEEKKTEAANRQGNMDKAGGVWKCEQGEAIHEAQEVTDPNEPVCVCCGGR